MFLLDFEFPGPLSVHQGRVCALVVFVKCGRKSEMMMMMMIIIIIIIIIIIAFA